MGAIAAAFAVSGLLGCLDLGIVGQVAFAPSVPGLSVDQPWVSMPVGAWVIESGIEPVAISACVSTACQPQAAVGLFRASGPEADRLEAGLSDPALLARLLAEARPELRRGRRLTRVRAVVTADRFRDGAFAGLEARLSRPDGSRGATGIAVGARRSGVLTLVLVVAATPDAARVIARDVVARLG